LRCLGTRALANGFSCPALMLSPLCPGTSRHGRASRATPCLIFFALNRSLSFFHGGMHKDDNVLLLGKISQITHKSEKESYLRDKEHERTIGAVWQNLLTTLIKKWGHDEPAP